MRRFGLLLGGAAVIAVGCGLPADDSITPYQNDDLGAALTETTSTTIATTTTTVVPPVIDSSDSTTSTTVVTPGDTVRVYYTVGVSDSMQLVNRPVPADFSLTALTELLAQRPDEPGTGNLRTAVTSDLIDGESFERGTVTVSLDAEALGRIDDDQARRAIAQIVLTLTSFRTPDQANIGAVRFAVDGDQIPVFVPSRGANSVEGEPLIFSDFSLLLSTPATPPSVTTPTAPPTTVPTEATPAVTTQPPPG